MMLLALDETVLTTYNFRTKETLAPKQFRHAVNTQVTWQVKPKHRLQLSSGFNGSFVFFLSTSIMDLLYSIYARRVMWNMPSVCVNHIVAL